MAFDGNGGLTVPFSAKLNPPAAFTFAAWVHPASSSGHRTVVSSRTSPSGQPRGFALSITAANTWEFWTGTGTTSHVLAGGPVAFDAWTHVAITRSTTGTKRIYINGVQAAGAAGGYAANADPLHGFHLGAGDDTGSSYRFVGRLDDAAFFPTDLGALLVAQHRDNGAGSFPTPLYPSHYQNDLQTTMAGVNPGVYARHRFTVADSALLSALRLRIKYDDAYVAYLNGVEVARRNFAGTREFNSVADTDRIDTQAVAFEDVDISAAGLPVLVNGANMLAVHGFRRSLTHEDFLLVPRLEASLTAAAQTSGYFACADAGGCQRRLVRRARSRDRRCDAHTGRADAGPVDHRDGAGDAATGADRERIARHAGNVQCGIRRHRHDRRRPGAGRHRWNSSLHRRDPGQRGRDDPANAPVLCHRDRHGRPHLARAVSRGPHQRGRCVPITAVFRPCGQGPGTGRRDADPAMVHQRRHQQRHPHRQPRQRLLRRQVLRQHLRPPARRLYVEWLTKIQFQRGRRDRGE